MARLSFAAGRARTIVESPDQAVNRMDVSTLLQWINTDSTSGREAAWLAELQRMFEASGWRCERQPVAPGRWNLWVRRGAPCVVFCTHVDCVPPFFGARVDGPLIRGRGACDTKGVLFAMVEATRTLEPALLDRVGFLLVVGEEVDHVGASVAAAEPRFRPDWIIMGEPTRNLVALGQRGILKVRIHAEGVAGHSAFPEAGTSAIDRLLGALSALRREAWPRDEVLGETRFNIGTIEGGVAANVYAPSAAAELLFRAVSDPRQLLDRVEELARAHACRCEEVASNPPVKLAAWTDLPTDVVPFNTDAPYVASLCPVTLVGPGDIRVAHSDDEHIAVADLAKGVELYRELVLRWFSGNRPAVR